MLASENRIHAGGGISVRVNGATVDSTEPGIDGPKETATEWADSRITWRGRNNAPSPTDGPQLVHVIRVKSGERAEKRNDVASRIRIDTPSPGVVLVVKAEDERSSSGASSAPGSDCDSDREADDGTDSGFAPSGGRHCATRIDVRGDSNVRFSVAPYADKDGEHQKLTFNPDQWDMHFHLRELESAPADKKSDSEDVQTKIAAAHALLAGQGAGTFSLKNRVRSSIVSLLVQSASNRNYDQEEAGRIVFYTTSMGIVRTTFERCRKVRKILETLMVKFEERDVFMNRGFQQEVRERLGITRVVVPQVFVEGRHLGSAEIVEQLNEIGHLRELLRPYKKQSVGGTCQQCGGYKYLLCPVCGGSKKSVTHRHHFSEDLVALRCVTCDESGLIRCPQCVNGEG